MKKTKLNPLPAASDRAWVFRLKPLLAALLLVCPFMQARYVQAEETTANTLPDLGHPNDRPSSLSVSPAGLTFGNSLDGKRVAISPEYSDQTGFGVGGAAAISFGKVAAGGVVFNVGERKKELLLNAGFQVTDAQRFVLSIGQLRQYLNIGFVSGLEKAEMIQTGGGASYQFRLEKGWLNSAEINAYHADTPSRDLADKTYVVDTSSLYEQWNDLRRVAGGRVTGLQGQVALTPLPSGILKLGLGGERLEYDYLTGKQSRIRPTGSAEYTQHLPGDFQFKIGADAASAQNRYTLGLDRPFGGVGLFGVNLVAIRGRDGAPDDNQIKLTWSHTFGSKRGTSGSGNNATPAWGSLLDQVAKRPTFIPAQVVAKLDTTAIPTRLIAVNKTALPAGSSVNTDTGIITTPLGVAATGIAAVTLNAAPFGNSGQFSLSGNNLVIDPSKITQPAVGVIDTYVVTVNNVGGGTTLVTILVSHGSVKIDSINIANSATDVTAPTTASAPSVSGTTDTFTTLSVTLSENGTGYYLVQAAAAAAPTVAAVQAGTAFAMTANIAATPAISGLAASTAYTVYFVAKDAANNVQATVQSVSVTTTAAADVTAPTTTAGPSVSGTTATATTLSATVNENGTGYYLVQAAAAAAPTVAAVQGGTAFAMTANVAASPAISGLTASTAYTVYFVAKDAANNVQAAVQSVSVTTTAAADVTAPTTTAGPSVSGTTDTGTTLSTTINENGTGYYLVQAAAAAAPTVAAVQGGTAFAMTANVAASPAISGLTASTAYTVYFVAKDSANNAQSAVQSVNVTTTAAADVTAPTTTAGPSVSGTTDTGTTLSATVNENGTGYYLVQAAAAAAPTVAAVQAGTSFAMAANVAATPAISGLTASTAYTVYFVAKDSANNAQSAVQSVNVTTTAAADVTAPTTTAGPSVSGTTDSATTLSATINENGTGYYLVQAAAAAAPTVAAVQAGTSFAMTANVAATPAISGLTVSTAYKIYFVAKDAANNVQAAVQSVAVTTSADVTPPAAPTGLALDNGAATTQALNVTLDGLTTPPDADLAGWFVSESASAPAAGAAGWSSTKPTSFSLATATTETKTVCVYVKDTSGNVQPTGACDTIDKVPGVD